MNPNRLHNNNDNTSFSSSSDPPGALEHGNSQWTQPSTRQEDVWQPSSTPRQQSAWQTEHDASPQVSNPTDEQPPAGLGGLVGWGPPVQQLPTPQGQVSSGGPFGAHFDPNWAPGSFQHPQFPGGISNLQYQTSGGGPTPTFGFGAMSPIYGAQSRPSDLNMSGITESQHRPSRSPIPHSLSSPPDQLEENSDEGQDGNRRGGTSLTKKDWQLPPRAKPGRKPDNRACDTKRKEQNREAQRAFRERRAAKLDEVKAESAKKLEAVAREKELMTREWEVEKEALWTSLGELRQQLKSERELRCRAEATLAHERSRFYGSQQHYMHPRWSSSGSSGLSSLSPWSQLSPTNAGPMPMLPEPLPTLTREPGLPHRACRQCGREGGCHCVESTLARLPDPDHRASSYQEAPQQQTMEVDFTRSVHGVPPGSSLQSEPCGFCTAPDNCLCTNFALDPHAERRRSGHSRQSSSRSNRSQPLEPSSSAQGPGTCDRCHNDPKRREFCQSLAAQSRRAPQGSISDSVLTCSETYDMLSRQGSLEQHSQDPTVMQALRTMPPDARRRTTGFDVDCASVLAAMRDTRRGSDGDWRDRVGGEQESSPEKSS